MQIDSLEGSLVLHAGQRRAERVQRELRHAVLIDRANAVAHLT
jgi:hypothetical protein